MQVKLLVDISGTRNGEPWPGRGESVDLPEDEARAMIAVGMAAEAGDEASAGDDAKASRDAITPKRTVKASK